MNDRVINIRDAKAQLSRLLARVVEHGERIMIARAGKPVAELGPPRKVKKRTKPVDDPLLRVDEYSYDGPIGPAADEAIDRAI